MNSPTVGGAPVSGPQLTPVVDDGLGNSAYLVDLGDGRALAVDPPRDLRALHAAAQRAGLTVAYAADTHLHADFLSGARQLAANDGARSSPRPPAAERSTTSGCATATRSTWAA
jgi:glyoxylase-like metal-dependent hydrolase (beta-lactamase superfamily II)